MRYSQQPNSHFMLPPRLLHQSSLRKPEQGCWDMNLSSLARSGLKVCRQPASDGVISAVGVERRLHMALVYCGIQATNLAV